MILTRVALISSGARGAADMCSDVQISSNVTESAVKNEPSIHHIIIRQLAPWSCQPFLHHGSSLHWLPCGLPFWLRSGSHLVPPAPGSSLHLLLPGSSCLLRGSSLRRGLLDHLPASPLPAPSPPPKPCHMDLLLCFIQFSLSCPI